MVIQQLWDLGLVTNLIIYALLLILPNSAWEGAAWMLPHWQGCEKFHLFFDPNSFWGGALLWRNLKIYYCERWNLRNPAAIICSICECFHFLPPWLEECVVELVPFSGLDIECVALVEELRLHGVDAPANSRPGVRCKHIRRLKKLSQLNKNLTGEQGTVLIGCGWHEGNGNLIFGLSISIHGHL